MPTYNPNIPEPTDILSDSQDDIKQNFQQLSTVFGINHHTYEAADEGKHKQVTLPENTAPTPTAINEANIYSRQGFITNNTELAWQRESNGQVIEFTGSLPTPSGWTILPSGILLKWGNFVPAVIGLNHVVVFPVGPYPVFDPLLPVNPFQIFLQPTTVSAVVATVVPGSITNLQFEMNIRASNTGAPTIAGVNWLAIGVI